MSQVGWITSAVRTGHILPSFTPLSKSIKACCAAIALLALSLFYLMGKTNEPAKTGRVRVIASLMDDETEEL